MACRYPIRIKSNVGEVCPVSCGSCPLCLAGKKTFWQHRIQYDVVYSAKYGIGSTFLGLSLNDDHLSDGLIHKDELQKFFKRLRKNSRLNFKHYSIGEYGDQGKRPHYHSIIIGCPSQIVAAYARKSWKYGFVTAEPVVSGRIRYVVDYLDCTTAQGKKTFENLGLVPPFNIHSNGIGQSLFDSQLPFIMETAHYLYKGKPYPVSEYWLNKLGVSINARRNFSHSLIADQVKQFHSDVNFKSSTYQAWQADRLHTKELSLYNKQINRLSPRYGRKVTDNLVFAPSLRTDINSLIKEVL